MKNSIFERYGGFTKASRIVMSFYEKVLDSPVTSPFFANTDMKRLVDHQTNFIASLMGVRPVIPTSIWSGCTTASASPIYSPVSGSGLWAMLM